jgi:DNA-binding PadR family transcriptional regulator
MVDQLRMTVPTQFVLRALLVDLQAELYGVEIGEAAGLPSGTVHPILARLEGLRWVQSRWEDIDPKVEGRPARRYYRLTAAGAQAARTALAEAYQSKRPVRIPRPVAEPS